MFFQNHFFQYTEPKKIVSRALIMNELAFINYLASWFFRWLQDKVTDLVQEAKKENFSSMKIRLDKLSNQLINYRVSGREH